MELGLSDFQGSNIEKGFINNDIQKAEGSRGGEVIGHTWSEKGGYKTVWTDDEGNKVKKQ